MIYQMSRHKMLTENNTMKIVPIYRFGSVILFNGISNIHEYFMPNLDNTMTFKKIVCRQYLSKEAGAHPFAYS